MSPNRKKLKLLIKRAVLLANLTLPGYSVLSFIFPGPKTMVKINKHYLDHNYLTDVICFNYGPDSSVLEEDIAIEIFISPDIALIRAEEIKETTYAEEMVLYLVHGILHAAGELDTTEKQKLSMQLKETEILKILKKEFYFEEIFPA